jgi:DNA-binding transcriptional LysR family regulator
MRGGGVGQRPQHPPLIQGCGQIDRFARAGRGNLRAKVTARGQRGLASSSAPGTTDAVPVLVPAIGQIRQLPPTAKITVEVAPSRQVLRDLASGTLDVAIGRIRPELDSRDFESEPMRDEPIAPVLAGA